MNWHGLGWLGLGLARTSRCHIMTKAKAASSPLGLRRHEALGVVWLQLAAGAHVALRRQDDAAQPLAQRAAGARRHLQRRRRQRVVLVVQRALRRRRRRHRARRRRERRRVRVEVRGARRIVARRRRRGDRRGGRRRRRRRLRLLEQLGLTRRAPEPLVAVVEEERRAGRDGEPADCVLLYAPEGISMAQRILFLKCS